MLKTGTLPGNPYHVTTCSESLHYKSIFYLKIDVEVQILFFEINFVLEGLILKLQCLNLI